MVKGLIAASGGYVVGIATDWQNRELWELIEIIELMAEKEG